MSAFNHWSVRTSQIVSKIGFMRTLLILSTATSLLVLSGLVFLTFTPVIIAGFTFATLVAVLFAWNLGSRKIEEYVRERRSDMSVDLIYYAGFHQGKPYAKAIDQRHRHDVVLEFVGDRPFLNRLPAAEFAV